MVGFRYGFEGLVPRYGHDPVRLTPALVSDIHHDGGTFLGTSRGDQSPAEMVDRLIELGIGALFVVGGDGTFRGAMKLVEEIAARGLPIAIVGVPKTIDNDIHFIDRSFGFETAFSAAVDVIKWSPLAATPPPTATARAATFAACPLRRPTGSIGGSWLATRLGPRWPATPRCSSDAGKGGSCSCGCPWRRGSASKSASTAICGRRSSSRPSSRCRSYA